ncbi:MAG TPA: MFS transporter [Ktedonosporobacter sp.]|nr:MFS transporter [Ktedonosporobacter sp.]
MYTVLRNRNYFLLWIGGLISSLGDWVLMGALPFYVYARTGSPLATGLTFAASVLPWIILSSVAGVFVDRWDLKRTMIIADLSRAALMLLLLLVTVVPALFWLVYLISFAEACITQFFNPASVTLLPRVVDKDLLQEANALGSFSGSLSRLAGPLLGGVLLALMGPASTMIADGISYVCSAVMIMLVIVPPSFAKRTYEQTQPGSITAYWRDWLEGLGTVKEHSTLRTLFLVIAVAALADGVINALFVIFPAAVLHLGSTQYGEMLTALGVGSLIGSFLVGLFAQKIPPVRVIWGGLFGKGLTYLLVFNSRSFLLVLLIFILSGTPAIGWQISAQTLIQITAEERLRGRVFGAYGAILSLFLLLGTGLGSVLAVSLQIVPVLDIGCGLLLVAGIVALFVSRKKEGNKSRSEV